jgi:hypothetical protein
MNLHSIRFAYEIPGTVYLADRRRTQVTMQ